jgi:hypothetical protein
LQQTSHLMFGPSAVPVLAKIDRGGAHTQDNVTAHVLLARGILDCGLPHGHGLAHRFDPEREQPEGLVRDDRR